MLSREVTAAGVRAVDRAGYASSVDADDFSRVEPGEFDVPVDAAVAGYATGFSVPATTALHEAAPPQRLTDATGVDLPAGEHVVSLLGPLEVRARFDGPATVTREDDRVRVAFDAPTRVDFGFLGRVTEPAGRLSVPATARGAAAAVTASASAIRTTSPARARPTMRRHPPRIEVDSDATDRAETADVTDTEVRVVVPDSLADVLHVAPLAHYLGASVTVADGPSRLRAPAAEVDAALEDGHAAEILERAFWLDALAWYGDEERLHSLDLDREIASASPAERLAAALSAPFEAVSLPEWPLAMYVDPAPDSLRALPGLLQRLAHVYPPETTPLDGKELVSRTLDDFYRTTPGPVATVEMENPRLRSGRQHGWLADGTPIDVFKAVPETYERSADPLNGDLSVDVVLNDPGMARERDRVADVYRDRATDCAIDVTLHADLAVAGLATVFESETDFVHYIGHCDEDGLLCADGRLSAASLGDVGARTFFLNACGSYHEGVRLVRRGSAAGAVTFRKVLDEHAAQVGTAFARLLLAGFGIERALSVARRRIVMGKDYAVVGDGTWSLPHVGTRSPGVFTVESSDHEHEYEVTYDGGSVWTHGEYEPSPFPPAHAGPSGRRETVTLTGPALREVLADADAPVVLDGEFVWADTAVTRV
ncbi:CHAT domain-containing protein [Salarchaeum sp. JOR-1]|uniref:CHAT domain-containing protein n=1 Tax=Salarchaeum sp. JOR-1 TaxID=2599399 RepID=UPI001F0CE405|nr:CHAT domain-containing protein [Salarchaeum sp. JOR-1]